jgi:hypothetical protein
MPLQTAFFLLLPLLQPPPLELCAGSNWRA